MVRPLVLCAVISAAFPIVAAIAGYHAVLGLLQIGVSSLVWREVFAWTGVLFIGGAAWAGVRRAPSVPTRRGIAEQLSARPHWRDATGSGVRRLAKGYSGDQALTDHVLGSQGQRLASEMRFVGAVRSTARP